MGKSDIGSQLSVRVGCCTLLKATRHMYLVKRDS